MARGKEWRTVSRYPQYEVSNDGEVRHIGKTKVRVLKQNPRTGYMQITLWSADRGGCKTIRVHRLVAEAFIENPHGKRCINHKDGNRTNNCVENLEWCTNSENDIHKTYVLGHNRIQPKAILCVESGITYPSSTVAGKALGIDRKNINKVTNGKRETAGGYHWRWAKGE